MQKVYYFLFVVLLCCVSCEWQLKSPEEESKLTINRYDRVQSLYLTTGDFSALQQMNTVYPTQTRTLIEDVIRIGKVDDPEINTKFLRFYQDSTLQMLVNEAEQQYANMDDINQELTSAFQYLLQYIPDMEVPVVYAQIGSLDQSVIVGNGQIGICLDKYLGTDYVLYQKENYGYSQEQKDMMQRQYIVPDCIGFYLLSLYPMPFDHEMSQEDRDVHMAKIQWVVNHAMGRTVFNNALVNRVEEYMKHNKNMTLEGLLANHEYQLFK